METLNADISFSIFTRCEPRDVVSCCLASKKLYSVIATSTLWQRLFHEYSEGVAPLSPVEQHWKVYVVLSVLFRRIADQEESMVWPLDQLKLNEEDDVCADGPEGSFVSLVVDKLHTEADLLHMEMLLPRHASLLLSLMCLYYVRTELRPHLITLLSSRYFSDSVLNLLHLEDISKPRQINFRPAAGPSQKILRSLSKRSNAAAAADNVLPLWLMNAADVASVITYQRYVQMGRVHLADLGRSCRDHSMAASLRDFHSSAQRVQSLLVTMMLQNHKNIGRVAEFVMRLARALRELGNINDFFAVILAITSAPIRRLQLKIPKGFVELMQGASSERNFCSLRDEVGSQCDSGKLLIPPLFLVQTDLTFLLDGNGKFIEVNGQKSYNWRANAGIREACGYFLNSSRNPLEFVDDAQITRVLAESPVLDDVAQYNLSLAIKPRSQ